MKVGYPMGSPLSFCQDRRRQLRLLHGGCPICSRIERGPERPDADHEMKKIVRGLQVGDAPYVRAFHLLKYHQLAVSREEEREYPHRCHDPLVIWLKCCIEAGHIDGCQCHYAQEQVRPILPRVE